LEFTTFDVLASVPRDRDGQARAGTDNPKSDAAFVMAAIKINKPGNPGTFTLPIICAQSQFDTLLWVELVRFRRVTALADLPTMALRMGGLNMHSTKKPSGYVDRLNITGLLLVAWFCSALYVPSLFAAEAKDKEPEGKVVLYSTMGNEHSKIFAGALRQLYPKIEAEFYSTGSSPLAERVLTEARSGKHLWDLVITTPFYTQLFMKRGLLAAYDSPERKFYRDGYKDSKGLWTSTYTNYAVFGYNIKMVPQVRVPKSHGDLLKPEWRGRIGMDARPYEWFAAFVNHFGEDKGLAFMRALAQQEPQLRNGRTLLGQLVAAGENAGSLTGFSQNFENMKLKGAPVDWVALDPVVAYLHPLSLSAQAPHPVAGRLFIDFLLSAKGQEIMRSLQRIPDRIDTLPGTRRLVEGIKPVFPPADVPDNLDRYIKLFDTIFKRP
jgi:iron(III) transport system substrate-binding protein